MTPSRSINRTLRTERKLHRPLATTCRGRKRSPLPLLYHVERHSRHPLRHQDVVLAKAVDVRQHADYRKTQLLIKTERVPFRFLQSSQRAQHIRIQVAPVQRGAAELVV